MKSKHCMYCNKNITITNFSGHKKTMKHKKNVQNFKPINLLEEEHSTIKIPYFKLQFLNIKKIVDDLLDKIV